MPRGVSQKREREYEELEERFKEEGRYPGREEEVAARIVNKQRAELGETKEAQEQETRGRSPDKGLPIEGYEHLTIPQVLKKAEELPRQEVEKIREFEKGHRGRKTLLRRLEQRLHARS
jgi:hypothetical protein